VTRGSAWTDLGEQLVFFETQHGTS